MIVKRPEEQHLHELPPQKKHLVVTQLADGFQSVSTNESDEQKIAAVIQLLNNKTKQDMYVRYRWLQLGNCQHVSYHYAMQRLVILLCLVPLKC